MRRYDRVVRCWVVCGTLAAGMPFGCASTGPGVRPSVAAPIAGYEDVRNVSRSGKVTFAGQPTGPALARFTDEGGQMVIDIRTHEGGDAAVWDEQAMVEGMGMEYVHIPVSSATMDAMDVKLFALSLRAARGPVLVHCGSSNRVGGLWAAYLGREHGVPAEIAIEEGKAAGMRSRGVEEAARRVIEE